jgi:hypothetical protein
MPVIIILPPHIYHHMNYDFYIHVIRLKFATILKSDFILVISFGVFYQWSGILQRASLHHRKCEPEAQRGQLSLYMYEA